MQPVPSASDALHTQSDSLTLWLWESARFAGSFLVWGLMISLVSVAACYCCGHSAYYAYLRRHPPTRRRRNAHPDPDDPVAADVARGLAEIEAYLATAAPRD